MTSTRILFAFALASACGGTQSSNSARSPEVDGAKGPSSAGSDAATTGGSSENAPPRGSVCPAFFAGSEMGDVLAWKNCRAPAPFNNDTYFVCHDSGGCGRPCKVEFFNGPSREPSFWIRYRYDREGRLTQSIECKDQSSLLFTLHDYDETGKLLRTRRTGRGEWLTEYEYDAAGLLKRSRTTEQDAGDSERIVRYVYDEQARVTEVRVSDTGGHPSNRGESVTGYGYSASGRIHATRTTDDDGNDQETYRYDDAGRLVLISWSHGRRALAYDTRGLLSAVETHDASNTETGGRVEFTYDEQRRLISVEDRLRTLRYSYECEAKRGPPARRLSSQPPFFPIPSDALRCDDPNPADGSHGRP